MEQKFTPGPWEIFETSHGWTVASPEAGWSVATFPYDDAQHEANARLVAAAPDMLTTLRFVAGALDDLGIGDGGTARRIKDVISKATSCPTE